jgi:tetratricopeptide (TPR) repeat protein
MRSAKALLATLCAAALLSGCAGAPKKTTAARKPAAPATATEAAPAAPVAKKPAIPAPATQAATSTDEAYAQAVKLLRSNQMQEAEAALLAAAKAHPQASGPQTNLGILYARTNRKAEARAAFARAVAANPANAVAHNWLGTLARDAGDLAAAERAYRAAIGADPAYAAAYLNLGILYDLYLKRPADALAAYRQYDQATGGKDVRAAVWIAEIEATSGIPAAQAPGATTPAAPAPPTKPAGGTPS